MHTSSRVPDGPAAVANLVHYASPLEGDKQFFNKEDLKIPGIYPSADVMQRLEYLVDVGEATRIYDQIWTELKAA